MTHHSHSKQPTKKTGRLAHRTFIIAILITITFAVVEGIGGKLSNSLTLLGDAGHMAFDSLALAISAFGAWLALKPPSFKNTYGSVRAEVLAAWISSVLMILLSVVIIIEAINRFKAPQIVSSFTVMIIATIGLLANLLIANLFRHTEKTLNIKAALLHVTGDILGSIAALLSGLIIYWTHWMPIDPILSIFISALILFSSVQLLRQSVNVLMEKVPSHLNLEDIIQNIQTHPNIQKVHDIHLWTLTSGQILLSAHINLKDLTRWIKTLTDINQLLRKKYKITHITIQPELETKPGVQSYVCEQQR